jgi:hypothetical protein
MKVLRVGNSGQSVKDWQNFLIGQGFNPGFVDGKFGERTKAATISFQQRHGMVPDGVVGNRTFGQAMLLGFEGVQEREEDPARPDRNGPNWPPPPDFDPIIGTKGRQEAFGKFKFRHEPTPDNPERIVVTDDWADKNVSKVKIPQLLGVSGAPSSGEIWFYNKAHKQLKDLWQAWDDNDLIDHVTSWAGSYVPRFIRGSRTVLSNHAFGTAFDINARDNALGTIPALVGKQGCVRELVELANRHGFYWGGHFNRRPDGMHFEIAKLH